METALQMYLNGSSVDLKRLPEKSEKLKNSDWGICDASTFMLHPNEDKTVVGDPRDATPALGEQYIRESVDRLGDLINRVYSELIHVNSQ
jgi:creatinine amidohydrolase